MRKFLAIILVLTCSACSSIPIKQSQFDGVSFTNFNGKSVVVLDQVENLQLAYVDRKENQFHAFTVIPDTYSRKPLSLIQLGSPSLSDANLVVPVVDERFIIVQFPPSPTPVLICEETHDPCALDGTLGCGGGFSLGGGESIKDLLQEIIESNEDSKTSLCGPADGGVNT